MDSENGRKIYRVVEIISGLVGIVAVPLVSVGEIMIMEVGLSLDYQDELLFGEDSCEDVMELHRKKAREYNRWSTFKERCIRNYDFNLKRVMGN
ncbi:MAG: hypothetical protein IIB08_06415 [Bacteroidetes bacterium]|nr:hypothetical protein [Bacteroidota bacterium]